MLLISIECVNIFLWIFHFFGLKSTLNLSETFILAILNGNIFIVPLTKYSTTIYTTKSIIYMYKYIFK